MSQPVHSARSEPGDRCLRFRAGLLCCGAVSVFSLLLLRLIHLQVGEHGRYQSLVNAHQDVQSLSASRGDILDTKGRMLACDEPVQRVNFAMGFLNEVAPLVDALAPAEGMKAAHLRHAFTLAELRNRYLDHLSRRAAPVLGLTEQEFKQKILARLAARPSGQLVLTKDLSISAALQLRSDLEAAGLGTYRENRGTLGALVFENAFARRYPADLPLQHVVGVFGETLPAPGKAPKPPRGQAGVERFFESQLTGKPGSREYEVDGWGNEIPAYRGSIQPPVNGRGVKLSLDLGLQTVVERALEETGPEEGGVFLSDLNAERVIVVLFDPATMGVRAICCRDKRFGPDKPMLSNPATEYLYEPGSTFKIATVAGAISSGKVNGQSRISLGAGGIWDDSDVTPIRDEHAASSLTVDELLIHSSNIGAYRLARMLGPRQFEQLIRDFGFCQLSGFESPSESRGSFLDERKVPQMTIQTLSRISYGMAIQVTPAQMCGALGAIINDGMMQPLHLAEAWVDENGQAVEAIQREAPRRIISPAAARTVRAAMLQVVEKGTGKPGRSELFEIAGKTGTARKAVTTVNAKGVRETNYQGDLICSFIGFIPADKPRLGGLVIIDTPKGSKHAHYGGRMAAPLFRRIAERAMAYYEVTPKFSPEVRLLPQAASTTPVRGTPRSLTR